MKTTCKQRYRAIGPALITVFLLACGGWQRGHAAGYHPTVVASTGRFEQLGTGPSINDHGYVAFSARSTEGENIYVGGAGGLRSLLPRVLMMRATGEAPTQVFGNYVQINNNDQVFAWRRLDAQVRLFTVVLFLPFFGDPITVPLTYWELYSANGPALPVRTVAMGGRILDGAPILNFGDIDPAAAVFLGLPLGFYAWNPIWCDRWPSPFDPTQPYDAVLSSGSINNQGRAVFGALLVDTGDYLANDAKKYIASTEARQKMMLADSGDLVLRSADGEKILLGSAGLGGFRTISSGFSKVSPPGISDSGQAIAFTGTLSSSAAEQISAAQTGQPPLTPGPGVFAVLRDGGKQSIVRVAGLGGNGYLDPGEIWNDANANGRVDPGEDIGWFLDFDLMSRVGVNHALRVSSSDFAVAFAARITEGTMALMVGRINTAGPAPVVFPSELVYTTSGKINLNDGVNAFGDLCFYVEEGAHRAIIKASTVEPEVNVLNVLTHGFGNSYPLDSKLLEMIQQTGQTVVQAIQSKAGCPPEEFFADWKLLDSELKKLGDSSPLLKGHVQNYTANWNSSRGFGLALFASAVYGAAQKAGPGSSLREIIGPIALSLVEAFTKISRAEADAAAQKIVSDLQWQGFLQDPSESRRGRQIIHLIGHSRGAAVNARVARLLTQKGFRVDQFTALDGYATDWPSPSGLVGDWDIAKELSGADVGRKVNYVVQASVLECRDCVLDEVLVYGAWLGLPGPARALTSALFESLFPESRLWKAPLRAPALEDVPLSGFGADPVSDHCNVVKLYANSTNLHDSFLGRSTQPKRRSVANAALPSEPSLSDLLSYTPDPRVFAEAAEDQVGFADGDFELAGKFSSARAGGAGVTDQGLQQFVNLVSHPAFGLVSIWNAVGKMQFVASPSDTSLRMLQTTNTSINQFVSVAADALALKLDLAVETFGADDTFTISFDDKIIAAFSLTNKTARTVSIPLTAQRGKTGRFSFALGGPAAVPSAIVIDNIRIVGPLKLKDWRVASDRTFHFVAVGETGRSYSIERSEDLVNWTPLRSYSQTAATYEVVEPLPPRAPVFYRVVQE